jgi:WD40 repeat protein
MLMDQDVVCCCTLAPPCGRYKTLFLFQTKVRRKTSLLISSLIGLIHHSPFTVAPSFSFSPDSKSLVIAENGKFSVFDLEASISLRNRLAERYQSSSGDSPSFSSALFSPDGKTLAVSYASNVSKHHQLTVHHRLTRFCFCLNEGVLL